MLGIRRKPKSEQKSPLEISVEQARAGLEERIGALDRKVRDKLNELYESLLYDRGLLGRNYANPGKLEYLRARASAYRFATGEKVIVCTGRDQVLLLYQ